MTEGQKHIKDNYIEELSYEGALGQAIKAFRDMGIIDSTTLDKTGGNYETVYPANAELYDEFVDNTGFDRDEFAHYCVKKMEEGIIIEDMGVLRHNGRKFMLINYVPEHELIWNIGENMADGYVPFCRLKNIQPFDGAMEIDTNSLKAVRMDGAEKVLKAVRYGQNTVKKMRNYVKKYSNSKKANTLYKVGLMKEALEVIEEFKANR